MRARRPHPLATDSADVVLGYEAATPHLTQVALSAGLGGARGARRHGRAASLRMLGAVFGLGTMSVVLLAWFV